MGAIFTAVVQDYPGQAQKANDLLTYPTLFMGIGNLISMPLAMAIGRRPVFLASMALLVASGIWCAFSKSLESHIAGRDIMALAAGQSEALVPLIVQEIHFLHEKGKKLSWFVAIENVAVSCFFIATQFLVASYGWRWWYGLFSIINAVLMVLSFIFVAETAFDRTGKVDAGEQKTLKSHSVTGGRWTDGLKLINITPRFDKIPTFYIRLVQGLGMPTILWVLCLNGIFLGLYVFAAATFAGILVGEYHMSFTNLAFVQGAQIIDCIIFLPLLGYGGDALIKYMAKRNNSFYKPEYRLFPLIIPAIVAVISAIIFGRAAANPTWGHWYDIAITYTAIYFGFLGANLIGITYTVDSFPTRAGPLLVLVCAGRGIISFGLSYSVLPAVASLGYDGSTLVFGVLCGAFAAVGVPVYFFGPRLRKWSGKAFGVDKESEENLD